MDFSPPNKLRFRNFLYARRHALAGFVCLAVFSYLFFSFVIPILAAPPTTKYDPGETLNPTCAPGDPNCTVTPPISGTGVSGRVTFFVSTSTVSSTAAFYWDNTNGFLGLGTSAPSSTLHIVGGGITQSGGVNSLASTTINGQATTTALSITSISGSTQCLTVDTNGVVSGTGSSCGAGNGNVSVTTANTVAGYIPTWTTSASSTLSATSSLFWDSANGRIGIGTTQPSSTLHVIGDINTTGNYGIGSVTVLSATGTANIFVGRLAGNLNLTGTDNSVLGNRAGASITSGQYNTFIGSQAGASSTTALFNTFVGNLAGNKTIGGGTNTFIGNETGRENTSGASNVYLGSGAGSNNATGSNIIAIGNSAGNLNEVDDGMFIGISAGTNNTTGPQNTFIGNSAGNQNTTGGYNTYLGYNSGFSSTGSGNVFLGYQAGYNETGSNKLYISNSSTTNPLIYGDFSTTRLGIGTSAPSSTLHIVGGGITQSGGVNSIASTTINGQATTTALSITSISGSTQCLHVNTNGVVSGSGSDCGAGSISGNGTSTQIAFYSGTSTLTSSANFTFATSTNTLSVTGDITVSGVYRIGNATTVSITGTNNLFVGSGTGVYGSRNTFSGSEAGATGGGGLANDNAFFGYQSGYSNTAARNSAFGSQAGANVQDNFDNAFFGYHAGYQAIGGSNVFVGSETGINNAVDGNTFIGYRSGYGATSGARNVFLGFASGSSTTTGTDNVFLGYNTGAAANVSNAIAIGSNIFINASNTGAIGGSGFKLGIGTTQPSSTLHIVGGGITQSGGVNSIASTTINGQATTTGLSITSISGSTQCLRVNSTGVISGTGSDCGTSSSTGANPTATIGLTAVNGTASTFMRSDAAPALSQAITPTWTGAHIFNGGLTANSTSTFSSSTIVNGQLTFGSASGTNISVSGYGIFPTLNSTNAALTSVSSTNITASGYGTFPTLNFTSASGTSLSVANTTTTALTISGISGSTQCLQVNTNGTVSGTGSSCGAGSGNVSVTTANTVAGYIPTWTTSASSTLSATSSLFWDSTNGRIGIGTTQPSSTLHVVGTLSQFGGVVSLASTTINGQATTTGLSITGLTAGSIPYIGTGGVVSQNNANLFWDNTNTRLGIGTNAPINALSVVAGIATTSKVSIAQSLTNDGSAPTTISSSSYLNIGGAEFGANSYRLLTFGYRLNGTDSNSPAYIGYQETNVSGRTNGDLIFGTRNTTSDVAPSERLRITTAGAILVATTTTPTNALFAIATSGNIFTVLSTNRVGIGTGAPATALDVISDGATVSSTLSGVVFARDSTAAKGVTLGYDTATGNGALAATGGTALGIWTNNNGWAERVRINASGSVGIGTTQPSSTLHVVGGATITTNVTTTNLTVSSITGSTQCLQVSSNGTVSGTGSGCAGNGIAGSGTSTQLAFFGNATTLTSDPAITYATTTGVFAVSATSSFTGKVGIGTATPLFSLHVSSTLPQSSTSSLVLLGPNTLIGGSASGTLLASNQPSSFNGHFLNFQNNSSTQFFISASGTVGVGTISPPGKFAIITTSTFKSVIGYDITDNGLSLPLASSSYLHLGGAEFGANTYRLLTFGYRAPATDVNFPAYVGYQETNSSGRTAGDLVFGTRPTNADIAPTERLRIRKDGTIEIGNVGQAFIGGSAVNIQTTSTYMVNIMRTYNGGTISAITSVGSSSSYLHLGGAEFGLNSYRLLSFGWHVVGSTTNFPAYIGFQEKSTSGNTLGDLVFGTRDNVNDTAATERIRITSGGAVGIGTDSPSSTLHVIGSSSFIGFVGVGTSSAFSALSVGGLPPQTSTSTLVLLGNNFITGGNASGTYLGINTTSSYNGDFLNLQVNSSSKLRVTSSGVMFVAGGLNASSTLTVESGATLRSTLTQSGGVVSLASTTINGQATTTALTITSISGSTQCLRVDTNGVVSGTGSACSTAVGTVTTSSAVTAGYFPFWGTTSALSGTSTIFQSGLNVGIGTTQPSSTLHVIGDIAATGAYKIGANPVLVASGTTNIFVGITAGNSNTTGGSNSYLGYQAGFTNATGSEITALGYTAGYNNRVGSVTFVGSQAGYSNVTGTNNTAIGYGALYSNVGGLFNTALGYQAGYATVSGDGSFGGSTFIGQQSGLNNTTGRANNFFGDRAGYNNTTGSENAFFGSLAGFNSAGNQNTFIGNGAGYTNTTGGTNSFFGYYAGFSNATGTAITAVGYKAGYNNTVGANTFLGTQAGYWDTTGAENTFVGYQAGYNTDTSDNAFFGYSAGTANSAGQRNTYLGARAGASADASFNVLIGYQAGNSNTGAQNTIIGYRAGVGASLSGGDNVFIGAGAGNANGAGNLNTFIGTSAGSTNDSGASNVFIGNLAGSQNSTGSFILALGDHAGTSNTVDNGVFLGYFSGQLNTVGVNNTFVGTQAGRFNTTGNYNMFSGDHAGYNNSTGSQITAIGTEAGYNNKADNNVFLGYQAGYNNVAGTGNIFIGYQAGYNASTSNNLYIDNSNAAIPLIYGDFANDRIGLGTANPDTNAKITIVGTTSSTLPSSAATVLVLGSSDGTTGGSSIRGRGTITGGLADVGEFAKVEGERSEYSAGDVLVISVTSTETFAKSSSSYQPNAVGIVTETAGILAGGGDETITYDGQGRPTNRVMIALAGRVPVKVSLENGPIQNGDYLTSSGKSGVAMKQTAPGATIGRAMEVFDENSEKDENGVGKVIVFVESGFSLGSGELVFATSTVSSTSAVVQTVDRFTIVVQRAIAKLGVLISNGVARLKEIFADKITTNELCIDDLCVNKAQLQQLLQQNGIQGGTGGGESGGGSGSGNGSSGGSGSDTGGGSGGGNTTTTPPTPDPTSSSTDSGSGGGTPPQDTPQTGVSGDTSTPLTGGSSDAGTPPAGDSTPPPTDTPPADTPPADTGGG